MTDASTVLIGWSFPPRDRQLSLRHKSRIFELKVDPVTLPPQNPVNLQSIINNTKAQTKPDAVLHQSKPSTHTEAIQDITLFTFHDAVQICTCSFSKSPGDSSPTIYHRFPTTGPSRNDQRIEVISRESLRPVGINLARFSGYILTCFKLLPTAKCRFHAENGSKCWARSCWRTCLRRCHEVSRYDGKEKSWISLFVAFHVGSKTLLPTPLLEVDLATSWMGRITRFSLKTGAHICIGSIFVSIQKQTSSQM
jgi:hypothetical protein